MNGNLSFFSNREINSSLNIWRSTVKIQIAFLELEKQEIEKKQKLENLLQEMFEKY